MYEDLHEVAQYEPMRQQYVQQKGECRRGISAMAEEHNRWIYQRRSEVLFYTEDSFSGPILQTYAG